MSDRAAVENLARQAIGRFGHFDVWINDAGVAAIGRFDQVPLEDHDQVIKTDLLGTIYGSHLALKHFRERNAGILINVASAIGKIPAPLYASYAAAKFGIVGLSDALRQELGEEKVEGHPRLHGDADGPRHRNSSSTPAITRARSPSPSRRPTIRRSRWTRW